MRILVIPDSFKGTFRSIEIAHFIEQALLKHQPKAIIQSIPIADGGEGSVDCFLHAFGGQKERVPSFDPYRNEIDSVYGWLDEKRVIIELAACAGLHWVKDHPNPSLTSTLGVGIQIKDAISKGAKQVILAIGGSSTNDMGVGLLYGLGCHFYDSQNNAFLPTGGTLSRIDRIDTSDLERTIQGVEFITLCDVSNPLYGQNGAAHVYGPQKGANKEMVEFLDHELKTFAHWLEMNHYGSSNFEGAGAAGGTSVAMKLFCHSRIVRGIDYLLETIRFDDLLLQTDVVITGEGQLDTQSFQGKVIAGIYAHTLPKHIPLLAIVGRNKLTDSQIPSDYFQVYPLSDMSEPLETAIQHTPKRIQEVIHSIFSIQ